MSGTVGGDKYVYSYFLFLCDPSLIKEERTFGFSGGGGYAKLYRQTLPPFFEFPKKAEQHFFNSLKH
jgi:hypothetical protein